MNVCEALLGVQRSSYIEVTGPARRLVVFYTLTKKGSNRQIFFQSCTIILNKYLYTHHCLFIHFFSR